MFQVVVLLKTKDMKDVETIKGYMKEISKITLAEEPSCRKNDVFHSQSDPRLFILTQTWDSRKDWEDHRNERAFRELYQPKVLPLVEREPHIVELIGD